MTFNTIFISSETTIRYKIHQRYQVFYSENKVGLSIIQSPNHWTRDYAPVQIEHKNYKFHYQPNYHCKPKYTEPNPNQKGNSMRNFLK